MTPQCQFMQDDLKAYLDGELSLSRRMAVRRHLAQCAACREELKIMEQIGQQLHAQEAPAEQKLNPELREKILTAIPAASPAPAPPRRKSPSIYRRLLIPSLATAATVFVLAIIAPTFNRARENARMSSPFASSAGSAQFEREAAPSSQRSKKAVSAAPAPPASLSAPAGSSAGGDLATAKQRLTLNEVQGGAYKRLVKPGDPKSDAEKYSDNADTSGLPSSLRRVHQEARIAVAVSDLEEKSNSVLSLVKSSNGYIASNTLVTGADGLKSATLAVRIPVRRFETVLAEIGKLGDVKSKNITGEDVTEQFSDAQQADNVLASELTVKESMLKAALLKAEKAEKEGKPIPTTWQLRAEVRRLRIEAAQTRARLELLKKISDLANIEVELREKPRTASEGGFLQQMGDTSRDAFDSFLLAARLPIMLLIWILAYAPLWLPLVLIYRFASREYFKKAPRT
jgi:hypothetical protein